MATETTNYHLKKPDYADTADIGDINGNMDDIDTALHGLRTDVDNAVKYTEQSLTASQKTQARTNIGAADTADVVKLTSQSLTDTQKAQARTNIGLTIKDASQSPSAAGGSGLVYDISNNTRAVIFCFGPVGTLCGVATVYCDASGAVAVHNEVEDMIISKSAPVTANKLWIKNNNSNGYTCSMKMLILAGDISR